MKIDVKKLLNDLKKKSDEAYIDMIHQARKKECLGLDAKLKCGEFGEAELNAHIKCGELLGRHVALSEARNMIFNEIHIKESTPEQIPDWPAPEGVIA